MPSLLQTPFNYQDFIEKRLRIINKDSQEVPFILNPIQLKYIGAATNRDIILKARQQGFSSEILAIFAADFLLKQNTLQVVVADTSDNAIDLLGRVKRYIESYELIRQTKVPLRYNSKYELENAHNRSRYIIGTAENVQFGRSKTIHNLHLSEGAFYKHFLALLASAGTAVVPTGRQIIETTANGFNDFKTFWDDSVMGDTGFKPHFFKASDFYGPEFLASERKRLGHRLFMQEYPETAEEAFIASGETYIENLALKKVLDSVNAWEQRSGIQAI